MSIDKKLGKKRNIEEQIRTVDNAIIKPRVEKKRIEFAEFRMIKLIEVILVIEFGKYIYDWNKSDRKPKQHRNSGV